MGVKRRLLRIGEVLHPGRTSVHGTTGIGSELSLDPGTRHRSGVRRRLWFKSRPGSETHRHPSPSPSSSDGTTVTDKTLTNKTLTSGGTDIPQTRDTRPGNRETGGSDRGRSPRRWTEGGRRTPEPRFYLTRDPSRPDRSELFFPDTLPSTGK